MSAWLNQTVTNGQLITIFVTWLACDFVSAAWKRSRKRRKVG